MAPWGCGRIDTPDLRGGDLRVTGAGRAPRLLRRSRGTVRRVSAARTDGDGSPKTSGDDVNRRPHADGPRRRAPGGPARKTAALRLRPPHRAHPPPTGPPPFLHCRSPGTLRPAHRVHPYRVGPTPRHAPETGAADTTGVAHARARPALGAPLAITDPYSGWSGRCSGGLPPPRPPPLLPRSVPWARPARAAAGLGRLAGLAVLRCGRALVAAPQLGLLRVRHRLPPSVACAS